MCGICGELRFDGEPPGLRAVERMSEQLARRGPDHAGTFADGPLAFGHRRLAIIDLSASADQPMVDTALQLAPVFNGTIYNYRELRAELVAMGYVLYWTLDATRPAQPLSEGEWLDAIRKVLVRALERHRLAADVPVGVLLSGGLDSSLLVGLLTDHVDDLLTFSIGFEDIAGVSVGAEKADEFEFSDLIAERFKTRHQKHLIPNREVLARLPEAVAAMTEPMMSHDVIAFYLLSERVSKEVKVVLAGQGADEVFGGYFWYLLVAPAFGPVLGGSLSGVRWPWRSPRAQARCSVLWRDERGHRARQQSC